MTYNKHVLALPQNEEDGIVYAIMKLQLMVPCNVFETIHKNLFLVHRMDWNMV